ncbi:acetyl-CoA carboxylase biotin carboxyl carrier protein [Candidatus Williamhamiltonella defendens]|uniref:Biotin carboxyl carrier protein of acetyl-CoA carboxylase n=1 Tax=Candidatus Hamiltonella defensa (Bemisia tabaci) TaxID=672795 RepID=A0A249DXH3_9ENTR|nr:acetyl-CoA carboxylase biotin carboxyl carrier protein [Candidatus Hamiltonella defensa]ASX26244.1 acetyl-CoA carboxylase, biotin carboxyl carrier protein [Candidatus Hamiltonella defensa (Bemisia tabaci)]CED79301.1 Biotin carboxyl carrier protein of acetyl-CoA carboxylase [Candidatus Hamiltonella defensa (Bemisia tabaci)]
MDIRKIKKLIELVEEHDISELAISQGEESIRINRSLPTSTVAMVPTQYSTNSGVISEPETKETSASLEGHIIRSPMVGTFYRTPSPDASPFVEVGQTVSIGDTLCIVEAMKMMNQIQADQSGVIKAILIENAQPVQFDQPLFIME